MWACLSSSVDTRTLKLLYSELLPFRDLLGHWKVGGPRTGKTLRIINRRKCGPDKGVDGLAFLEVP